MADPVPGEDDWLELYCNDTDDPCLLTGLTFIVNGQSFTITAPAVISGDSELRLWCDPGAKRGDNLNLSLPREGGTISIIDPAGSIAATQAYGPQQQGITQGLIGGMLGLQTLPFPSPNEANVLLAADRVVLNEVLVINHRSENAPWGRRPAWIELHNPSTTLAPVSLAGYGLRVVGPIQHEWTFPAGTMLAAGDRLVVWADQLQPATTTTAEHLNSGLPIDGSLTYWGVELIAGGTIQDRVIWGPQVPDTSIGRLANNTWALLQTSTRGAANSPAHALAPATGVKLNEWFSATAAVAPLASFLEVFNPATEPANISGLWLGDSPSETGRRKWQVPALSFVGAQRHTHFTSGDSTSQPNVMLFDIAAGGEYARLSQNDAALTAIDAVGFGPPTSLEQTQGRLPDGSATVSLMIPTPSATNASGIGPVIISPPQSIAVPAGQTATFTAVVSNNVSSLQWTKDGVNIPGAIFNTFSIPNVTATDEADYRLVATGAATVTSAPARLDVVYTWTTYAARFGLSSLTADADNDGLDNGSEFLLGTHPTAATTDRTGLFSAGMETLSGIPHLTMDLRISEAAAFCELTGELSADLQLWSATQPTSRQILSTEADGSQRVRLKFAVPTLDPRHFLRLRLKP